VIGARGALRVLHVDSGREWRGGQAQVAYLLSGLAGRGYRQGLAAPPASPLLERARGLGVEAFPTALRGDADLGAFLALRSTMKSFAPDIVHAHSAGAHGVSMAAARSAGIRRTVVTRRLDLPVGRSPFSRAKYRHGVARYIAISRRVRDSLVEGGVEPGRIRVVYSGVPVAGVPRSDDPAARAAARARLGVSAGALTCGLVGAFTSQKGQDVAIAALARTERKDLRLVLVGDGADRSSLERQAADAGVADRVLFAGFRDDVPHLWPAFDFVAAPSRHEGLGTSVLEAMAAGQAVVATRVAEFDDMLDEGRAGLLVPSEDPAALARALDRLAGDAALRATLGGAARERVGRYAVEGMVTGTDSVYREFVA
jgi:glycosyltransferase involved in cell wall biosynthesis